VRSWGLRTWSVHMALASGIFGVVVYADAVFAGLTKDVPLLFGDETRTIGALGLAASGFLLWVHKISPQERVEAPPPLPRGSGPRVARPRSDPTPWRPLFAVCGALTLATAMLLSLGVLGLLGSPNDGSRPWLALGSSVVFAAAVRSLVVAGSTCARGAGRWTDALASFAAATAGLGAISMLLFPTATAAGIFKGPRWIAFGAIAAALATGAYVLATSNRRTGSAVPLALTPRRHPRRHHA
jgi:hypothetical protein